MLRGIQSAATAMQTAAQNHEVVAHNLAHANVPGFRKQGLTFEPLTSGLDQTAGSGGSKSLLGTKVSRQYTVFDAGDLNFTGSPLDVAIKGDSFFVLNGPRGPLYTRAGVFELDPKGELRSTNGLSVLGQGGPIAIPQGTSRITVTQDGTVLADKNAVGKLQLARFDNPAALIPAGTTLFEASPAAGQQTGTGTIHQGYREGSNVQVVTEMVNMIAGMRHYEAAQRALRALGDSLELNTRPQS